jgi:hypothetical protein
MCGVCIEENVEVGLHVVVFTNIAKPHDVLEEKELQTCASSTLEACDFLTQSGEHAAKLSRLHCIASSLIFYHQVRRRLVSVCRSHLIQHDGYGK